MLVTTAMPFQIMRADAAIVKMFKNCKATWVCARVIFSLLVMFTSQCIFLNGVYFVFFFRLEYFTCRTFILRNSANIFYVLTRWLKKQTVKIIKSKKNKKDLNCLPLEVDTSFYALPHFIVNTVPESSVTVWFFFSG